jgi:transposase
VRTGPKQYQKITLSENAIRPTALERRTVCFSVTLMPANAEPIIYSIIESCRRHRVEPYSYLHDVLTRLPSMTNWQIKNIVPKAWAASRSNTALRAA